MKSRKLFLLGLLLLLFIVPILLFEIPGNVTDELKNKIEPAANQQLTIKNNDDEDITVSLLEISGHYKAFDSFDLDQINTFPNRYSGENNYAKQAYTLVKAEYLEHKKVLNIHDESSSHVADFQFDYDSSVTTDIVEFWICAAQTTGWIVFTIEDSGSTEGFGFSMYTNGNFLYYYASNWRLLESYSSDTWYHIKIELSSVSDSANLTINDNYYSGVPFYAALSNINVLRWRTIAGFAAGDFFIDAIDIQSQDVDYYQSRNYELNSSMDLFCWEANPEWHSQIRSATYNYQNDLYYTAVDHMTSNSLDTSYIVESADVSFGHCWYWLDNDALSYDYQIFSSAYSTFKGSFWIYPHQSAGYPNFYFCDSGGVVIFKIAFDVSFGQIRYWDVSSGWNSLHAYSNDNWYYVSFEYIASTSLKIYLNNEILVTDISIVASSVGQFHMYNTIAAASEVYIDCIDFSFDSNWYIERAMYENSTIPEAKIPDFYDVNTTISSESSEIAEINNSLCYFYNISRNEVELESGILNAGETLLEYTPNLEISNLDLLIDYGKLTCIKELNLPYAYFTLPLYIESNKPNIQLNVIPQKICGSNLWYPFDVWTEYDLIPITFSGMTDGNGNLYIETRGYWNTSGSMICLRENLYYYFNFTFSINNISCQTGYQSLGSVRSYFEVKKSYGDYFESLGLYITNNGGSYKYFQDSSTDMIRSEYTGDTPEWWIGYAGDKLRTTVYDGLEIDNSDLPDNYIEHTFSLSHNNLPVNPLLENKFDIYVGYGGGLNLKLGDTFNTFYDVGGNSIWNQGIVDIYLLCYEDGYDMFSPMDTFSVNLLDDNDIPVNIEFEIPLEYCVNQSVFISLYDQQSHNLNFGDYKIYTNNTRIYSPLFQFDLSKDLNIKIYDNFNYLLYENNYSLNATAINYINIELALNSFKVSNRMKNETLVEISRSGSGVSYSSYLEIDEVYEFRFEDAVYIINYTDDSGIFHSVMVNLTADHILILNTTYHLIYFSIFDISGLGIPAETVRFYINNERSDFGANWVRGSTLLITVKDYLNYIVYNTTVNWADEIDILVDVYTMWIFHNYTSSMIVKIRRANNYDIFFKQELNPWTPVDFRFLAGVEYRVQLYYPNNGSLADSRTVWLNETRSIELGYYTDFNFQTPWNNYFWFGILAFFIIGTLSLLYRKARSELKDAEISGYGRKKKKNYRSKVRDERVFY